MLVIDKDIFFDGPTGCFSNSSEGLCCAVSRSLNFDRLPLGMKVDDAKSSSASFCLSIFDACNLGCAYCFNKDKKGKSIDLKQAIAFLEECFRLFPNKDKYHVDLSGKGEPLLYLRPILAIKEYCLRKQDELRKEVLVQFVCNGTLLTPQVAQVLQSKGVLFGVSIDGNRAIHDANRLTKNGESTYDLILRNVNAISNHQYVGAAATLTKKVFPLIDSLKELGKTFNTVGYKPARDCAEAFDLKASEAWAKEYEKLTIFLIQEAKRGDLKYLRILLNGDDYFGKFIKRLLLNQRVVCRCDGGISRLSLDSSGHIYPCPAAFPFDGLTLGDADNINKAKRESLFQEQIRDEDCHSCEVRHVCGGECLIEKRLSGGNNQAMCLWKKHLIYLAGYLAISLANDCPAVFKEIKSFAKEVSMRNKSDPELVVFLNSHPELSFTEGKRIFDRQTKRY